MPDEIERWERVQESAKHRQPFQARSSTDSRHADAHRRRNLDKEEAARDRLIFRWVLLVVSIAAVLGALILMARNMGTH
ncbi:MAG: hypothetical protein V4726_02950 [Verrucomicrobiota bacterium]